MLFMEVYILPNALLWSVFKSRHYVFHLIFIKVRFNRLGFVFKSRHYVYRQIFIKAPFSRLGFILVFLHVD